MDIDKLIPILQNLFRAYRFSSLMDIDKLILEQKTIDVESLFSSLMDIDKLIHYELDNRPS